MYDGSYMEPIATNVWFVGVYIYYKRTKQMAKCAVVGQSDDADNYRAEILGAVMTQLILRAATTRRHGS